jgi:hypothetical protein
MRRKFVSSPDKPGPLSPHYLRGFFPFQIGLRPTRLSFLCGYCGYNIPGGSPNRTFGAAATPGAHRLACLPLKVIGKKRMVPMVSRTTVPRGTILKEQSDTPVLVSVDKVRWKKISAIISSLAAAGCKARQHREPAAIPMPESKSAPSQ